MIMNVSLDTDKINAIDISTLDFRIRQHLNSKWTSPHLQKLAYVSEVRVTQSYKHTMNISEPLHSFIIKNDDEDPSLIWGILMHPEKYIWYNTLV